MHTTGYNYNAHVHMAQIKNAREHCVHVTDYSGWEFSTTQFGLMHVHMWISHKCEFGKEGSFFISAKLAKEELIHSRILASLVYISISV